MNFGLKAKHYFLLLCGIVLLYLIPGFFYWNSIHPDYAKCIWGDPICSLTVATYLLTFVTGCAFVAAFQAAWYALKTYDIGQKTLENANETLQLERTAILGVQECREDGHHAVVDAMLHSSFACELRSPSQDERETYYEMHYEFASLGRTPAVEVKVWAEFAFIGRLSKKESHKAVEQRFELGNFKRDGDAHVTVWVAPELLDFVEVKWVANKATQVGSAEEPLEFHPLTTPRPDYRGIASYNRTIGEYQPIEEVPIEQPAPAETPTPTRTTPID